MKNVQITQRFNNYDLLRIVCCIAVIVIHVSATYKNAIISNVTSCSIDTQHIVSTLIWNTLSRFAVPCFVMLSGAFLLSNNKNMDYKYFYKKSFKKLVLPTLIFSLFFFIYNIIKNIFRILVSNNELAILLEPIEALLKGNTYYHLWYLYMIIGIYLLTPIVLMFKNSISKKAFSNISWIFLIFTCISAITSTYTIQYSLGFIVEYLGYFMIGYEIKEHFKETKNNKLGLFLIVLGILAEIFILPIQYNMVINKNPEKLFGYSIIGNYSPFIMISSILLFAGFSNLNIQKDFSKLSSLTLYIYIFHALIWDLISEILIKLGIINASTSSRIVIPFGIVIVFILSYVSSLIWTKIKNWINKNNRLYNKIDKAFEKL